LTCPWIYLSKNDKNGEVVELFFVGVGEACDSEHGNTSVLVTTGNKTRILLDCGFSVPHSYFRTFHDSPDLDYIWISHFHGDHFFGLPLLFLRLWQMKRTAPLTIVGQQGIEQKVTDCLEMAYPGFEKKLSFALAFQTLMPGRTENINGIHWTTAETEHSQYNLGLLLDDGDTRLYYSGDGRITDPVRELVTGCDLMIHEAFTLVDHFPYHGSISSCLKLAEQAEIRKTALLHLDRDCRKNEMNTIIRTLQEHPGSFLPLAGETVRI
jgi:ribonuclease BN (tRNA processing enzyme)